MKENGFEPCLKRMITVVFLIRTALTLSCLFLDGHPRLLLPKVWTTFVSTMRPNSLFDRDEPHWWWSSMASATVLCLWYHTQSDPLRTTSRTSATPYWTRSSSTTYSSGPLSSLPRYERSMGQHDRGPIVRFRRSDSAKARLLLLWEGIIPEIEGGSIFHRMLKEEEDEHIVPRTPISHLTARLLNLLPHQNFDDEEALLVGKEDGRVIYRQ